jgi:hypothetical protein
MIDPEVARLRRLRDKALRVRDIARRVGAAQSNGELFERGACASWRVVRAVSGKLMEHPYQRYQQGAGVGSLFGNRVVAEWTAFLSKDRPAGLRAYATEMESLARMVGDARLLTRSTEFSDALGRSQNEIRKLLETVGVESRGAATATVPAVEPRPMPRNLRAPSPIRTDGLVGELAKRIEADWPYLAF